MTRNKGYSFISIVMVALLLACEQASSQIPGMQNIGCIEPNMTMTRVCYFASNTTANWNQAWTQCGSVDGGQLALLDTPESDSMIGSYIVNIPGDFSDDYLMWIGGRERNDSTWRWIDGQPFNATNTSSTLVLFSQNLNWYETCSAISVNASSDTFNFKSDTCKTPRPFICQQNYTGAANGATATTCTIGPYRGVVIGNRCYAGNGTTSPLPWYEARYNCSLFGADLAVFDFEMSKDDQATLFNLLAQTSNTRFWIGLRKLPWVWVTNFTDGAFPPVTEYHDMIYAGWLADNPYKRGRSCMAMDRLLGEQSNYGWTNSFCNQELFFFCQQTTHLTTPAPNTTLDYTYMYVYNTTYIDSTWNETFGKSTTPKPADNATWLSLSNRDLVNIIVPCVIVAVVLIVIGFSIYCYFAKRRDGYTPHP